MGPLKYLLVLEDDDGLPFNMSFTNRAVIVGCFVGCIRTLNHLICKIDEISDGS